MKNVRKLALTATIALLASPCAAVEAGYSEVALGYAYMAGHDYASAEKLALKALTADPDNVKVRLLLLAALKAQKRYAAAETAATEALRRDPGNGALLVERGYLRQTLHNPGGAAEDLSAALSSGRLGSARPRDVVIVLADAALAAKQPQMALDALTSYGISSGYDVFIRRGYALQALGRHWYAVAAFDAAANRTANRAERRRAELAAIDELLVLNDLGAARERFRQARDRGDLKGLGAQEASFLAFRVGDTAAASAYIDQSTDKPGVPVGAEVRMQRLTVLRALGRNSEAEAVADAALAEKGGDAAFLVQRGYLRQQMKRYGDAAKDFSAALASGRLTPETMRAVSIALADAAMAQKAPQRALDALAPFAGDSSYDVQSRRGYALKQLGRYYDALSAFDLAAAHADTASRRAQAQRAAIDVLMALGRGEDARHRIAVARARGETGLMSPLDQAYLDTRMRDYEAAYRHFRQADADGDLVQVQARIDAAYAAKHTDRNAEAAALFKQALDADAGAGVGDGGQPSLTPQNRFGLRREVGDLERSWGAYSAWSYGGIGVAPGSYANTLTPDGGRAFQNINEIYWRPPVIGYRDGATVELFGRVSETLEDTLGNPTGLKTTAGSLGVRWKPFVQQNLVLEAYRQFSFGSAAESDWLSRIAYSAGSGSDLRVDASDWWYWQVYAEGDYYWKSGEKLGSFELRGGRTFRFDWIDDRFLVAPFVALGGAYDSALARRETLSIGPGISLRQLFREDAYRAPQSYVDLSVQYRFTLEGGKRSNGLSLNLTLSY